MPEPLSTTGAVIALGVSVVSGLASRLLRGGRRTEPTTAENLIPLTGGPGQWVVGTAKTQGLIVDYAIDERPPIIVGVEKLGGTSYRDLHLAIAVSEGACDGLDGIDIGDQHYRLVEDRERESDGGIAYSTTRVYGGRSGPDGALFKVIANFNADGTQGALWKRVSGVSESVYLNGISWLHVILRQPYDDNRQDAYDSVPSVAAVVRGVKVPDPLDPTAAPRWTDSATDVYHWFLTNVMNVQADQIDTDSVTESRAITDASVTTLLDGRFWPYAPEPAPPDEDDEIWGEVLLAPTASEPVLWAAAGFGSDDDEDDRVTWTVFVHQYLDPFGIIHTVEQLPEDRVDTMYYRTGISHTSNRYTLNGVIGAGVSAGSVTDEMDVAWTGQVVDDGGKYIFRPGHDRDPVFAWTATDVATRTATLGALLSDSANVFQGSVRQSRVHDYRPWDVEVIEDRPEIEADGRRRPVELRAMQLVSHPVDAARLIAGFARLARRDLGWTYSFRPQQGDPDWYLVRPRDVITLTDEEYGLSGTRVEVDSISFAPDGLVSVSLTEAPLGAYSDAVSLSAPTDRQRPVLGLPPAPTGLSATLLPTTAFVRPEVDLEWTPAPYRTELQARVSGLEEPEDIPAGWTIDPDDDTQSLWLPVASTGVGVSTVKTSDSLSWGYTWDFRARHTSTRGVSDWSDAVQVAVPTRNVTATAISVTYDSVSADTIEAGLVSFRVVRVFNVRITGSDTAELVYRIDSGDWADSSGAAAQSRTLADDRVVIFDNPSGGKNIAFVSPGIAGTERSKFATFAARTGAGDADDPYEYHGAVTVSLNKDIDITALNRIVDSVPTTAGGAPEGTMFWEIE